MKKDVGYDWFTLYVLRYCTVPYNHVQARDKNFNNLFLKSTVKALRWGKNKTKG